VRIMMRGSRLWLPAAILTIALGAGAARLIYLDWSSGRFVEYRMPQPLDSASIGRTNTRR